MMLPLRSRLRTIFAVCAGNTRAAEIAVETVKNWLDETGSEMKIVFNVFKDLDFEIYEKLLNG